MTVVTETVSVKAAVEDVFSAYVEKIDAWWPRQAARFRYSFAPPGVSPRHIRFEARVGGRLYETFSNGDEYAIGTIQTYSPPHRLVYTWKDPDWDAETLADFTFKQSGTPPSSTYVTRGSRSSHNLAWPPATGKEVARSLPPSRPG